MFLYFFPTEFDKEDKMDVPQQCVQEDVRDLLEHVLSIKGLHF